MSILKSPLGFPPSDADLRVLVSFAVQVGSAFHSRLIAADFGRLSNGSWSFIEAGPGSCAGTEHEAVFKAVAGRLKGESIDVRGDAVGGLLTDFF
jgi:hypothetical protein